MDCSAEKHFAQTFIRKNRRERLLYALTIPKKRVDGAAAFAIRQGSFWTRIRFSWRARPWSAGRSLRSLSGGMTSCA